MLPSDVLTMALCRWVGSLSNIVLDCGMSRILAQARQNAKARQLFRIFEENTTLETLQAHGEPANRT